MSPSPAWSPPPDASTDRSCAPRSLGGGAKRRGRGEAWPQAFHEPQSTRAVRLWGGRACQGFCGCLDAQRVGRWGGSAVEAPRKRLGRSPPIRLVRRSGCRVDIQALDKWDQAALVSVRASSVLGSCSLREHGAQCARRKPSKRVWRGRDWGGAAARPGATPAGSSQTPASAAAARATALLGD